MTNIWAETYKEIREPFFEIEDPYTISEEKKEKEKEEEEGDEDDAGEEEEHKYKKSGKKSKDFDGDGKVEDESHEYAGVKDRAIKKAMKMKEERELKSKSTRSEKIDIKKDVNNKIDINPSIKEEVEEFVNYLVSEGYDLSDYTWEDMYKIYEENIESDTSKRKAAQAQIRKELADVQLAKANASAQRQTNESVIAYLENRYNL